MTPTHSTTPTLAALLLILSGCGVEGGDTQEVAQVLTLVEACRASAPEELPLSSVRQIALAPSGAVAVLDNVLPHVLLFDPQGGFEGILGRRGEGPGEFGSLFRVGRTDREAWAVDARRRSLARFELPDGTLTDVATPSGELAGAVPLGPAGGDSVLLAVQDPERVRFVLANRSLTAARDLVAISTSTRSWSVSEGSSSSFNQPLAPYPLAAPWSGGVVVVDRSPKPATRGEPSAFYRIEWWGPGGFQRSQDVWYAPQRTTESDIDAALAPLAATALPDVLVRTGQFGSPEEVLGSARERMIIPATLPPIRGGRSGLVPSTVLVEPSGRVWLERWDPDPSGRDIWEVVGQEGPEAIVHVPGGLGLLAVSGLRVWAVVTDPLGVPTLVGYDVVEEDPEPGRPG